MATVLKQQESLNAAFYKRAGVGFACAGIGVIIIIFFTRAVVVGGFLLIAGTVLIRGGHKFHLGAVGENRVANVLARFPDEWFIFNDMVVGRSQIDHLVVAPVGVFTIETKNYRGTIYGNAAKQKWSQVINHHETTFYNPVKQGIGHSVALSKFLAECGLKNVWVDTIVVFAEPRVNLKVFSPKVPVIYLSELRELLNKQKQVMDSGYCTKIATCVSTLIPA
ncbi:MAG: NERD domain-containing protein [Methanomicrobia archaeon]|nr:NERD domain-containing protein [Methanomicrobia archaeon]